MNKHAHLRPADLLRLMRPKHYIKNFLIFVSITFSVTFIRIVGL